MTWILVRQQEGHPAFKKFSNSPQRFCFGTLLGFLARPGVKVKVKSTMLHKRV